MKRFFNLSWRYSHRIFEFRRFAFWIESLLSLFFKYCSELCLKLSTIFLRLSWLLSSISTHLSATSIMLSSIGAPAIFFIFSKKRCIEIAKSITTTYNDYNETVEVNRAFDYYLSKFGCTTPFCIYPDFSSSTMVYLAWVILSTGCFKPVALLALC